MTQKRLNGEEGYMPAHQPHSLVDDGRKNVKVKDLPGMEGAYASHGAFEYDMGNSGSGNNGAGADTDTANPYPHAHSHAHAHSVVYGGGGGGRGNRGGGGQRERNHRGPPPNTQSDAFAEMDYNSTNGGFMSYSNYATENANTQAQEYYPNHQQRRTNSNSNPHHHKSPQDMNGYIQRHQVKQMRKNRSMDAANMNMNHPSNDGNFGGGQPHAYMSVRGDQYDQSGQSGGSNRYPRGGRSSHQHQNQHGQYSHNPQHANSRKSNNSNHHVHRQHDHNSQILLSQQGGGGSFGTEYQRHLQHAGREGPPQQQQQQQHRIQAFSLMDQRAIYSEGMRTMLPANSPVVYLTDSNQLASGTESSEGDVAEKGVSPVNASDDIADATNEISADLDHNSAVDLDDISSYDDIYTAQNTYAKQRSQMNFVPTSRAPYVSRSRRGQGGRGGRGDVDSDAHISLVNVILHGNNNINNAIHAYNPASDNNIMGVGMGMAPGLNGNGSGSLVGFTNSDLTSGTSSGGSSICGIQCPSMLDSSSNSIGGSLSPEFFDGNDVGGGEETTLSVSSSSEAAPANAANGSAASASHALGPASPRVAAKLGVNVRQGFYTTDAAPSNFPELPVGMPPRPPIAFGSNNRNKILEPNHMGNLSEQEKVEHTQHQQQTLRAATATARASSSYVDTGGPMYPDHPFDKAMCAVDAASSPVAYARYLNPNANSRPSYEHSPSLEQEQQKQYYRHHQQQQQQQQQQQHGQQFSSTMTRGSSTSNSSSDLKNYETYESSQEHTNDASPRDVYDMHNLIDIDEENARSFGFAADFLITPPVTPTNAMSRKQHASAVSAAECSPSAATERRSNSFAEAVEVK